MNDCILIDNILIPTNKFIGLLPNDIFKFIFECYRKIDKINQNKDLISEEIDKIIKEFIEIEKDDIQSLFNFVSNKNYSLFPNNKDKTLEQFVKVKTLDEFIKKVEELSSASGNQIISENAPNKDQILNCEKGLCVGEEQMIDDLFKNIPSNIPISSILPNDLKNQNQSDLKILKNIFLSELDNMNDIIKRREKYKWINQPNNQDKIDMVFVLNELRILDIKLEKIIQLTSSDAEFTDVYQKSLKIQDDLYQLIEKIIQENTISVLSSQLSTNVNDLLVTPFDEDNDNIDKKPEMTQLFNKLQDKVKKYKSVSQNKKSLSKEKKKEEQEKEKKKEEQEKEQVIPPKKSLSKKKSASKEKKPSQEKKTSVPVSSKEEWKEQDTREIDEELKTFWDKLKNTNVDKKLMDKLVTQNKNNMMELLEKKEDICSPELFDLFREMQYKLDYTELSNLVSQQFYNPEIMKTMNCLIQVSLQNELDYIELLKNPLYYRKADNTVFIFSHLLNGKTKVINIKHDKDKILHEGVVGLFVGNKIREVIPTFSWTYGFTDCNFPILSMNQIKTACTESVRWNNKDYIGLMTEYIDGPLMAKYILDPNLTLTELSCLILSVLYSIKYAHEMYEYVHWDLHSENIILRKLEHKDENYIYLPNEKKYLNLGGEHLPTIIDYGFSAFRMNGKLFGRFDDLNSGVNPTISNSSLNDVLKFFVHLYMTIYNDYSNTKKSGNQTLIQKRRNVFLRIQTFCLVLLSNKPKSVPFKFEDIDTTNLSIVPHINNLYNFMEKSLEHYSYFPNEKDIKIEDYIHISLDNLIEYIIKLTKNEDNFDLLVDNPPSSAHILSCSATSATQSKVPSTKCLSEKQILDDIFSGPKDNMTLNQMMPWVLNQIPKDEYPIFQKILTKYLDEIKKDLETPSSSSIFWQFNDLRINELKLERIEQMTRKISEFKNIHERTQLLIQNLKDKIETLYPKTKTLSDHQIYSDTQLAANQIENYVKNSRKEIDKLFNKVKKIPKRNLTKKP